MQAVESIPYSGKLDRNGSGPCMLANVKGSRPELESSLLQSQKLVQHFAQQDPTGSISISGGEV